MSTRVTTWRTCYLRRGAAPPAPAGAGFLAAPPADLSHVFAILADNLPAFAAGSPRFLRRELVCGAFDMGSFTAHAGDIAQFLVIHRSESTLSRWAAFSYNHLALPFYRTRTAGIVTRRPDHAPIPLRERPCLLARVAALAELFDHLLVKGGNVIGLAARHEPVLHVHLFVYPRASGVANVRLQARPGGQRAPAHHAGLHQHPRCMAYCSYRLTLLDELAHEAHGVFVQAHCVRIGYPTR